jgi:Flp pilus assembly protein TadD
MQALEPPDLFRVSAAEGWLELGDLVEARAELDEVSPPSRNHPAVLEVRWTLLASEKDWETALEVGRTLLQLAPENAVAWLHHAYALRRAKAGGLPAAWDALWPALEKFPENGTVAYNLACYACQLQKLADARLLLQRALTVGGRDTILQMALRDPDLEPLRQEIRGM